MNAWLRGRPTTSSNRPWRGRLAACSAAFMIETSPPSSFCGGATTSNSTICTCPSANTSVWRAAGTPIVCETASAASRSDDTTQSTSSWRSRQTSRYSSFPVLTIVRVLGVSARQKIDAMMLTSSREVQAMSKSEPASPASSSTRLLVPFPSNVATSNRMLIASSRLGSSSTTVSSCSLCRASTIVEPTWPAPMTKIFTAAGG